jgi:hypothetical protein
VPGASKNIHTHEEISMTRLHLLGITVSALGLALGALLSLDTSEASGQTAKDANKTKAPKAKAPPKATPPKAAKPSVLTKANTSVKPVGAKEPEAQKTSDQQLVQGYRVLRSVKKTLSLADHDYGGHRADAMRDIGKAEGQLREALAYQDKKAPKEGKTAAPPWHPEPQRLSNAQVAAALPVLHRTLAVLERANHDYGGHKANAVADLKTAVSQLKQALTYAKK